MVLDRRDDPSNPTRGWFSATNFEQGVPLANTGLFAIVLAELVNSAVVLISYRRGWHG